MASRGFSCRPLATASPWLLLRWHWTGNPIFPLLNERFPNPLWGPGSARLDWDTFGLGAGPGDFLRLPWDLTVESGAFAGTGAPPGVYGVAVLLAFPLFLAFLSRQERLPWVPLLVTAFAGAVMWFLNTPYFRYALPLLPILCGLSAMNIVMGYEAARKRFPRSRLLPAAAIVLAVAYLGSTRLVTTASVIREPERYPVAVAFGREAPAAFLARHLEEMPALAAMQATDGAGNALSLGMPHGLYYDGTLTEALDFSPRFRYLLEIDDPELLLAELRDLGAEHVLINWSNASRFLTKPTALTLSDGSAPRDPSAVPLLLSHSRFLRPVPGRHLHGQWVFGVRHSRQWSRPFRRGRAGDDSAGSAALPRQRCQGATGGIGEMAPAVRRGRSGTGARRSGTRRRHGGVELRRGSRGRVGPRHRRGNGAPACRGRRWVIQAEATRAGLHLRGAPVRDGRERSRARGRVARARLDRMNPRAASLVNHWVGSLELGAGVLRREAPRDGMKRDLTRRAIMLVGDAASAAARLRFPERRTPWLRPSPR